MKKTYLHPELEVVDVLMEQSLLTGSDMSIYDDPTVTDPTDLLAPALPADIPGMPNLFN